MIRQARKEDNAAIAVLVLIILKDMELPFVEQYGEEKTLAVLKEAILSPAYRYGYARGIVEEIDGQVAGVAFGYPAADEAKIDEPLQDILTQFEINPGTRLFLDEEAFAGEWYLDTICVSEDFRGQGVGTNLLKAVDDFAKEAGESVLGLNVDEGNPQAAQLYKRLGYEKVGECVLNGHKYEHLQKKLEEK